MRKLKFKDHLHQHSEWRGDLILSIEMYQQWRERYNFKDANSESSIMAILESLKNEKITLAFAAEFSRGKTELINALFFAETGVRLLPSSPGRTTMCPTELFYDQQGSYIKLLPIETRLNSKALSEYKESDRDWIKLQLESASPKQMQEAFKALVSTKKVTKDEALTLGLFNEKESAELGITNPDFVEIPCWRHALISFNHPLLKEGLTILDTPGLNSLGSEPELTLSMLPNAQAIIFVLAADTGVTKSDMDMWVNYIGKSREKKKQGLAIVMNKIDSMWDDLQGEDGYHLALNEQVKITANTLQVPEDMIFPLSAKQALLGKVKDDAALLERSRISFFEDYLSKDIMDQRKNILLDAISRDIGFLVLASQVLTDNEIKVSFEQLEEFRKIDFENSSMTGKLLAETKDRQNSYMANVENFQGSRRVFTIQAKMLVDSLSREKVDVIVKRTKSSMSNALTTYGMKKEMRNLINELRDLLQEAVDITNETRLLIKAIHKKFKEDYGFKEIEPKLFSIQEYQVELERIFNEGEAFRESSKTTMTEQSAVVERLYSTLIVQSRDVLKEANKEALSWSNSVLTPLMHQIKDHKKQIESRLQMIKKISDSKESVSSNIKKFESELEPLVRQKNELSMIIKRMGVKIDK